MTTALAHTAVQPAPIQKIAPPSRVRKRHTVMMLSFVIWVLLPVLVSASYLYLIAQDQYASELGFSVRKEDANSAMDVFGGLTELSGSSSSDTDILYKFINSRQMVRAVNHSLDLHSIYTRAGDPVFTLTDNATIEDLEAYWNRMVDVYYDSSGGLIELRILAFTPQDAQNIAKEVLRESTRMINEISEIAREDSISFSRKELDRAIMRLKDARSALSAFRTRTQIIDPSADIQGRMSLLNTLQSELAGTLVDLDILLLSSQNGDPRITQARRRVDVIQDRIAEERERFGGEQVGQTGTFSTLIGDYEALSVDLEFAQNSYISALAAFDAAVAESQQKSRYLAAYIPPTLATTPQYPQRATYLFLVGSIFLLSWVIAILIYYSVRDRR